MRMFKVKEDMGPQALASALLDSRISASQAEAAMERVKKLNPHVDLKKLHAGSVVFVPDTTGFKAPADDDDAATPLPEFASMVKDALGDAAKAMKLGLATRSKDRDELGKLFKSSGFKRLMDSDKELVQQAEAAMKNMSAEAKDDSVVDEKLAQLARAAAKDLDLLGKLTGRGV